VFIDQAKIKVVERKKGNGPNYEKLLFLICIAFEVTTATTTTTIYFWP